MRSKLVGCLILVTGLMLGSCFEEDSVNPYQRLQEDILAIDEYLSANPPDEEDVIIRDISGLRMVITEMGTGIVPPTLENIIQVSYVGRILSNGKITQPFEEDDAFTFTLTNKDKGGDVITGWKIALRMMTRGTKARIYLPSLLGYGTAGSGNIPGNALLVFDLELKVVHTANEQPRLANDIATIDEYIADHNITNVQVHPSGMRYVVQNASTGSTPGLYDKVIVKYTGKIMNEEETVFADNFQLGPSETFSSWTVNYVHGLIHGLQLMSEGSKFTFYLPSPLGYGPNALNNVPANSILIYEIELLEVIPNPE